MKSVKKLLATAIAICGAIGVNSQDKVWEHNVYVSAGKFIETATEYNDNANTDGLTLKLGYGLNRYFTESFSVMGGLALHLDTEKPFENKDGADYDGFRFIDIPVTAQYHLAVGNGNIVFGFGPVFAFCIGNDTYYYDADPRHPINGKKKIKPFNFSLMPGVAYETKRMRFGVDGSIGLLDVQETHNLAVGSKHLHNVCATIDVKF